MDISKAFKEGFDLFVKNPIEAVIGFLIVMIISVISFGFMAPALHNGYALMLVKAKRGNKISVNDIFAVMHKFFSLLGLTMIIGVICILLSITIIGFFPAVFLCTLWMYSGLYIVDKNKSVMEALSCSADLAKKNNVWLHVLFFILIIVFSNLGYKLWLIGGLVTSPIAIAAMACNYEMLSRKK